MSNIDFDTRAAELRARNEALAAEQPSCAPATWPRRWACPRRSGSPPAVAASRRPRCGEPQAIFRDLGTLGEVMALTRNDWCVHERHGRYQDIQADGPVGLVLGPDIDLRVFFSCWRSAWAVEQDGRHSLQFFDGEGVAVHKVYRGHRCGRLRRAGRASRGSVAVAGKHAGRARPTPPAWPTASSGAPPGWA